MRGEDFERYALALIDRGFNPLPIMPASKSPGARNLDGSWRPMRHWNDYCTTRPTRYTVAAWLRMIRDDDVGIGVACGMGLICIDIDFEECMAPLLAILPVSYVQKKGKKGVSLFYRGNTDKIRSRNYRTPDRVGLVDLLSEGKQTVLPPSIHPDTGEPYYWWTDDTLMDLRLEDLTELPDDIAERIGEVLKAFGYDPEGERTALVAGEFLTHGTTVSAGGSEIAALFRTVNGLALANLSLWVPRLGLRRCYRAGSRFAAVAEWRPSSTGRAFHLRKSNLSFRADGIRDFGDGRGYSPIDVVIAAHRISASDALHWLAPLVGVQLHDPDAAVLAEQIIASAKRKKEAYNG